jgi:hypothetical protein
MGFSRQPSVLMVLMGPCIKCWLAFIPEFVIIIIKSIVPTVITVILVDTIPPVGEQESTDLIGTQFIVAPLNGLTSFIVKIQESVNAGGIATQIPVFVMNGEYVVVLLLVVMLTQAATTNLGATAWIRTGRTGVIPFGTALRHILHSRITITRGKEAKLGPDTEING